jgi:hypothetical protein
MKLTDQDILKLLEEPRNRTSITEGAQLQNDHKVHITGDGATGKIRQVTGYESSTEFAIKTQLGKPATIEITSIILDNLNRWITAPGTVKKEDFRDDDKNRKFQDVLSKVWNNNSFDEFIRTFYKEAIYTVFNGFVLVTKPKVLDGNLIDKEGVVMPKPEGALNPYLIFIDINDVHDFFLTGDKVEYLIIKLDDKKKKFRVIDDARDLIIEDKKITSDLPNDIGYVPARKISNINKDLLNCQTKTSPIDHVIPALDRYMSADYDHRMQVIRHAYPKFIAVVRECHTCHGSGEVFDEKTPNKKIRCNSCEGKRYEIPVNKDGAIGIPQYLEQGQTPYPGSPASYVTPDVESLKFCDEDLKQMRENIIYSGTGDKNLIAESLNTATENTINNRSLEDRIAEITSMVEAFEVFIKTAIKDMHQEFTSISDYSIVVKYGKRINIRSEQDIVKEIQEAKKAGMNLSYIQGLQIDLIYAKYKNNEDELNRQLMLNDLEPFPGFTVDEILRLAPYADDEDLQLKTNFENVIDKFEENGPVTMYPKGETYKQKINLIKEELYALLPQRSGTSGVDAGQSLDTVSETSS